MKMVIVMRKDLNMRKGKMCAQAGHAALGVWGTAFTQRGIDHYKKWFENDLCTKICLSVNSEEELLNLYNKALEEGIIVYLVEDAGITEFNGNPTFTCLAFEPLENETINPLTGGLPLL